MALASPDPSPWTKQRISLPALFAVALILCLILVRFPPTTYAFYPPCPIHAWTGYLCPGCGGTRALAALLQGQWTTAWHANPLIVSAIPFSVARILWRPKVPNALGIALAVGACLFGVLRNV